MKEKLRKLFTNVWTIPNVLTMLRLILVPVFVVLFWNDYRKAALVCFVVASFTDFLDGFLARKLNQITDFGKLFDPLADKLMVLTALVCQALAGVLPWAAIAIVGAKELYMILGGAYMLRRGIVVYANMAGKVAQVCFIASLILSFFQEELRNAGVLLFGLTPDLILLWITVGLSLFAMGSYTWSAYRKIKEAPSEE